MDPKDLPNETKRLLVQRLVWRILVDREMQDKSLARALAYETLFEATWLECESWVEANYEEAGNGPERSA